MQYTMYFAENDNNWHCHGENVELILVLMKYHLKINHLAVFGFLIILSRSQDIRLLKVFKLNRS